MCLDGLNADADDGDGYSQMQAFCLHASLSEAEKSLVGHCFH